MNRLLSLSLVSAVAVAACAGTPDLAEIPVGSQVQLTRNDGGVVRGTLAALDGQAAQITVGEMTRSVEFRDVADVQVVDKATPEPTLPAIARFRELTVPAGTRLIVRLESAAASDTSRAEDAVEATLIEPVTVAGLSVLPTGSIVRGEVQAAEPGGTVKGRARLALRFRTVAASHHDEPYHISARIDRRAAPTKSEDAGNPAADSEVQLPRGATLVLSLDQPVALRVPIERPQARR